MTTLTVVSDGTKRRPTVGEWETLLESRIPEVIRRVKEGSLDPAAVNFTMQQVIEGKTICEQVPTIIAPPVPAVQSAAFKTADYDLHIWLRQCQEFMKEHLGVEFDFARFTIPTELPWKSAIPVFDPGNLTSSESVTKALKASGLAVYEEVDVMRYSGSEASGGPSLHFIQNSVRPDADTMNLTPDHLVEVGKNLSTQAGWLSLRGYAFAFALHHAVTGEYLDPQTFTWFPNNRLATGEVALGDWLPGHCRVRFYWNNPGNSNPDSGARLAMPVYPVP